MDCSPPGSSVHGIFQARTTEWVAISFSRESSWPRITQAFSTAGSLFTFWAQILSKVFCYCYNAPSDLEIDRPRGVFQQPQPILPFLVDLSLVFLQFDSIWFLKLAIWMQ